MPITLVIRILLCWCFSCCAYTQPLSLVDLTKVRQVVSATISPDGNKIAFTVSLPADVYQNNTNENLRELYIANKQGELTPFITGANSIGKLQWSDDNSTIFFLGSRLGDNYISLYAISTDGGEARKVLHHNADIEGFHLNKTQTKLLFWARPSADKLQQKLKALGFEAEVFEEQEDAIQHLWLLNLSTNKTPQKLPFEEHIIEAQFQPQSDNILVQSSPSALIDDITMRKKLFIADVNGDVINTFQHKGKMGKVLISPNGKYVAVIGANDKHAPSDGRLLISSKGASPLRNLTTDLAGQVEDIAWLSNNKIAILVHQNTDSYIATARVDRQNPSFKKWIKNVGIINKVSASSDNEQLALIINKPEHPKELYRRNKRGLKRLTNLNQWLDEKTLADQQVLTYEARDGLEIEGVLVKPKDSTKQPAPLIIVVHGGPEAHVSNGWLNHYSAPAHYAASRGFLVFFPNYRGSTGRGVNFSKMGQKDYAGKEFDDLVDAKDHLVRLGLVDPKKVGITGSSYGGYASAWAATKLTEHFAASVATMGISNQLSKFGTTDIPTEMIQLHARQAPWENWQWMLQRSPVFFSEQANTPLLIMHGKQDSRVHYSQSMELYRYIKLQNKTPVRLVLYPSQGHGFRSHGAKLDYSMRLMRWMEHFLIEQSTVLPDYNLNHEGLEQ